MTSPCYLNYTLFGGKDIEVFPLQISDPDILVEQVVYELFNRWVSGVEFWLVCHDTTLD